MNTRISIQKPLESLTADHRAFKQSVHKYLDMREEVLFDDFGLDLEILREVSALYRVVRYMIDDKGVRPMPDLLKRLVYVKRDIYHVHRDKLERKKYSSRKYINNHNFR